MLPDRQKRKHQNDDSPENTKILLYSLFQLVYSLKDLANKPIEIEHNLLENKLIEMEHNLRANKT